MMLSETQRYAGVSTITLSEMITGGFFVSDVAFLADTPNGRPITKAAEKENFSIFSILAKNLFGL
jgi:hypothetical protein